MPGRPEDELTSFGSMMTMAETRAERVFLEPHPTSLNHAATFPRLRVAVIATKRNHGPSSPGTPLAMDASG